MELLYQLYKVHSPSRKEKKMRKFIKDWVRRNVKDAKVEQDKTGNVYVTRGESENYPCIVAHMDQVQSLHSKDFKVWRYDGKLFGFSGTTLDLEGLGADDKNGIWVALKSLQKYPVMKCAFFVGEEIGCVGSDAADMTFFDDCRWVVQCDRKNGSDLITRAGGTELCSDEFVDALKDGMLKYGYKETTGLMTDVMTLKDNGLKVSCINMSCGYYRPHTDKEYTVIDELDNCLAFVNWIVENLTEVYPHEFSWTGGKVDYGYGGYGHYGYGKYDDYYDGWYDDEVWDPITGKFRKVSYTAPAQDNEEDDGETWDMAYDFCLEMLESYPMMSEDELDEQVEYHYPEIKKKDREVIIGCAMDDFNYATVNDEK